jgi:curved DNA-binding protein CbpA
MSAPQFVDYYEVLQISPNANSETIERMFRYLARHYHPDNPATADRDRFDLILQAHNVLRDPEKRAQYDIEHRQRLGDRVELAADVLAGAGIDRDLDTQSRLLELLYAKRRRDLQDPGLGNAELEALLGCPIEHLEFNIWYMKEKRWIRATENGTLAITVEGVDKISADAHVKAPTRLLTDQS